MNPERERERELGIFKIDNSDQNMDRGHLGSCGVNLRFGMQGQGLAHTDGAQH